MATVYFYRPAQYLCACCGSFMRHDFLPPAPSAVTPRVIQAIVECGNPNCEQFRFQVLLPLECYDTLTGKPAETWEPFAPPEAVRKEIKRNADEQQTR